MNSLVFTARPFERTCVTDEQRVEAVAIILVTAVGCVNTAKNEKFSLSVTSDHC